MQNNSMQKNMVSVIQLYLHLIALHAVYGTTL